MSNFVVQIPAGPVRPYALFGLGLIRPHNTFNAAGLAVDRNSLGYDVGGGLIIMFHRTVGVRGDVRHFRTFDDFTLGLFATQALDFWRGSLGLVWRF